MSEAFITRQSSAQQVANLYVWKRNTATYAIQHGIEHDRVETFTLYNSDNNTTIYYASSVSVVNENIVLNEPIRSCTTSEGMPDMDGKYYYTDTDTSVRLVKSSTYDSSNYTTTVYVLDLWFEEGEPILDYITSDDPSTYPSSGSVDNVVYNYLGKIGELLASISYHGHSADEISTGTFMGYVMADNVAQQTLEKAQVRNIAAGTVDLDAGVTTLATGQIYFVYE